jgi:hypothetical protein
VGSGQLFCLLPIFFACGQHWTPTHLGCSSEDVGVHDSFCARRAL